MKEIERVRQFDQEWQKLHDYEWVISKFIMAILLFCSTPLYVIPFQEGEVLVINVLLLQGIAVWIYMRPYLVVKEERNQYSITSVLAFCPIDSYLIRKVRVGYLRRFCGILSIVNILLQQLGAWLGKTWGIENLLYPILGSALVYACGYLYIWSLTRQERK